MDPKISPSNSNVVVFIHHNDLWVTNVFSNKEKRSNSTNSAVLSVVDQALSAGVPSFVIQEEFDCYTGYFLQPRTETDDYSKVNKYCILYEEVCLRL